MTRDRPWQRAEIPGPIKAFIIEKPESLAALMKRAKRLVIVVGNKLAYTEELGTEPEEFLVSMAKALKAHLVATGKNFRSLREKGYEHIYLMPAPEIVDRLRDPSWRGLDGGGQYDMAVFAGFPYYYEWVLLNGLKHSAYKHLKTISLDPYYHPNATFALPNLLPKDWCNYLKAVVKALSGE